MKLNGTSLSIVEKAEQCEGPGEIGRLLRSEGCTARIFRLGGRRRGRSRCRRWRRGAGRSGSIF